MHMHIQRATANFTPFTIRHTMIVLEQMDEKSMVLALQTPLTMKYASCSRMCISAIHQHHNLNY